MQNNIDGFTRDLQSLNSQNLQLLTIPADIFKIHEIILSKFDKYLSTGEMDREVKTTKATRGHGKTTEEEDISYTDVKVIGKGTFGVVYRARLVESGDLVAIKKVFHDERYKVCNIFSLCYINLALCIYLYTL